MKKKLLFIGILFSSSIVWSLSDCQGIWCTSPAFQELTKVLEVQREKAGIVGMSVAVVYKDEIVYARGFGFANKEKEIPATPETVYGIGSITKLFTATAVMQLLEEGRVILDAPINKYIREFTLSRDITPLHLLTHYTGLPSRPPAQIEQGKQVVSLDDAVKMINKNTKLLTPKTSDFHYSNIGYLLLGRLIEVTSHSDFADYIARRILQPLEMTTASVSNRELPTKILERLATSYRGDKPFKQPFLTASPAGGLFASVIDMSHFMMMFLNKGSYKGQSILKAPTVDRMFSDQTQKFRVNGPPHGIGWALTAKMPNSTLVVSHNGRVAGFMSDLMLLPNERLGAVVLSNIGETSGSEGSLRSIVKEALAAAKKMLEKSPLIKI